jgi:hypothetical protein
MPNYLGGLQTCSPIGRAASGFKADKIPLVFNGDSTLHPVKFLHEIESYFRLNRVVDEGLQKEIAVRCLEGAADNWVGPRRDSLTTFSLFKSAFLHRYWSEAKQEEVRAEIYNGKYSKDSRLSFADYFNKILNLARYLTILMTDSTVMKHIASHFPARVGRILVGAGGQLNNLDADAFTDWLQSIDEFEAENTRQWEQQEKGGKGQKGYRSNAIKAGSGGKSRAGGTANTGCSSQQRSNSAVSLFFF